MELSTPMENISGAIVGAFRQPGSFGFNFKGEDPAAHASGRRAGYAIGSGEHGGV